MRFSLFLSSFFSLLFTFYAYAGGAGVVPLAIDDQGDAVMLLGKEIRYPRGRQAIRVWEPFGGSKDPNESFEEAAHREFLEETGYTAFSSISKRQIQHSPYVDELTQGPQQQVHYRLYFTDVGKGVDGPLSPATIRNHAARAIAQLGARNHVEKLDWAWVKVRDILNTIRNHGAVQMPGQPENLYGFFTKFLRKNSTQAILNQYLQYSQQAGAQIANDRRLANAPRPQAPRPFLGAPLNAQPKDVLLTLPLHPQTKQNLFQHFVSGSIPGKAAPDHYHVTLAWVKDVQPAHKVALKTALMDTIDQARVTFSPSHAGRYLVGNRTPQRCGVVLYPEEAETIALKQLNQQLYQTLNRFNQQHGTHYDFLNDVKPASFTPHITLANTHHLNANHVDRDRAIDDLNNKLNQSRFFGSHAPFIDSRTTAALTEIFEANGAQQPVARPQQPVAQQPKGLAKQKTIAVKIAKPSTKKPAAKIAQKPPVKLVAKPVVAPKLAAKGLAVKKMPVKKKTAQPLPLKKKPIVQSKKLAKPAIKKLALAPKRQVASQAKAKPMVKQTAVKKAKPVAKKAATAKKPTVLKKKPLIKAPQKKLNLRRPLVRH